jgi:predicted aspartyl protease
VGENAAIPNRFNIRYLVVNKPRRQRQRYAIKRPMKKLFAFILSVGLLAPYAAKSQQQPGTLAGFLSGQGLAGAKLERRFGNHLLVPASINTKRAALIVDTGAPVTLIDKDSAATFGLKVESTTMNVGRIFGPRWEHYGVSVAKSIALGNCVVTNVPVLLADISDMNAGVAYTPIGSHISRINDRQHSNGLFGAREMNKFGMIIDCARQMLYINPNGSSTSVSQKLASFLSGRGFTRIPMRWDSGNHLEVSAVLNGHPTRLIVDTGAAMTTVDRTMASQAGVGISGTRFVEDAGEGHVERLGTGDVKELKIGDFTIPNATVSVVSVSGAMLHSKNAEESNSGLMGAEYLAWNFAVIDVGGMALYLRHPDSR